MTNKEMLYAARVFVLGFSLGCAIVTVMFLYLDGLK